MFNIGKAGNRRRATQVLYHEVLAQQNTSCSYHHTLVLLNIDRDSHSVSRPSKIDSSIRNNPPICDLPVYIARNYIYFTSIQCNHSRIVPLVPQTHLNSTIPFRSSATTRSRPRSFWKIFPSTCYMKSIQKIGFIFNIF